MSESTPLVATNAEPLRRKSSLWSVAATAVETVTPTDEYSELVLATRGRQRTVDVNSSSIQAIARNSVYSPETVADIAEKYGMETAEGLSSGFYSILIQIGVFSVTVMMGVVQPLVYEWALWDSEKQEKQLNYIPSVLMVTYYACSVLLGNILSLFVYGPRTVAECWNPLGILFMVPSALILAFVETMDGSIFEYLDGPTYLVIRQLKLPVIALIGTLVLRRYQTSLQWILIMGITFSVVGYSVTAAGNTHSTGSFSYFGLTLAIIQTSTSCFGIIVTEYSLKNSRFRFSVQMSHARIVSTIVSLVGLVGYCQKNEYTSIFQGWTSRIVCLALWLAARDFAVTYVLKCLSAVWKALATGVSVCVTYLLHVTFWGLPPNPILICFILCMVTDIIGFSLAKKKKVEDVTPAPTPDLVGVETSKQ